MPNYPGSLDSLTNPAATDPLSFPSHSSQHTLANDILEALERQAGARGTSFPGSPTTGDRFTRTDRDIDYEWNGTRWLSTTLYHLPIPIGYMFLPLTASTGVVQRAQLPHSGVYDLWLENFQGAFYVNGGTALSASHKWVATLQKSITGSADATVITATIDSGASNSHRTTGPIAINALAGTNTVLLWVFYTKTGTPGNLDFDPSVTYRLVG